MKSLAHHTLLVLCLFQGTILAAQDVEAIVKADPLQISGGIQFSGTAYQAYGTPAQRDPFFWNFRANLNLNVFNTINAPLSISFTPNGNQLNYPFQQFQPLNQIGISPTYRGFTLHLGYRSMPLSTYSLAGNAFYGAGIDWKIKKSGWRTQALFGRLAQAVTNLDQAALLGAPLYNRWVYGGKVNYHHLNFEVGALIMKAWDEENSIIVDELIAEKPPQENLIAGLEGKMRITKHLQLQAEYTWSAYTDDVLSGRRIDGESPLFQVTDLFFTARHATSYDHALKTSLTYQLRSTQLGVNYQRVDPNYRSLGTPFLNNDMENITGVVSTRLFKNKMTLSVTGGVQQNNLDDSQVEKTRRLASGANLSWALSEGWNVQGSYSNFTTNTQQIRIEELDSLTYYQVTENYQGGLQHQRGGDTTRHTFGINGMAQFADDVANNNSEMYTGALSYSLAHNPSSTRLQARINVNQNSFIGLDKVGYGPTLSGSKSFLDKKLRTDLSFNHMRYVENGDISQQVSSLRLNLGITLHTKHQFSLSSSWIHREIMDTATSLGEWRATLQYSYRFMKSDVIRPQNG